MLFCVVCVSVAKLLVDIGEYEAARVLALRRVREAEAAVSSLAHASAQQRDALLKHYATAAYFFQETGDAQCLNELALKALEVSPYDFVRAIIGAENLQSVGDFRSAFQVYGASLERSSGHDLTYLLRFRRSLAEVLYSVLDLPLTSYNLDNIVDTKLKAGKGRLFGHTQESLPPEEYTGRWRDRALAKLDHEEMREGALISVKDESALGGKGSSRQHWIEALNRTSVVRSFVALDTPGFHPHERKLRAAALGALQMAQTLRRHVDCVARGFDGLYVGNAAASSVDGYSTTTELGDVSVPVLEYPSLCWSRAGETTERSAVHRRYHSLQWRDLFDVAVRWRQLGELADNVWWWDKITLQQKEIEDGFSTPIIYAAKNVSRYGTYFVKSFELMKREMLIKGFYVNGTFRRFTASEASILPDVRTMSELYDLARANGTVHIVATCKSTVDPSVAHPCTRLSLTNLDLHSPEKAEGWDFRIASLTSLPRYRLYSEELKHAFDRVIALLLEKSHQPQQQQQRASGGSRSVEERIQEESLRLFYYWVHLSPLLRGSSLVGYMAVIAINLAGESCLAGKLPTLKQLDWEALLSITPDEFIATVTPWLDAVKVSAGRNGVCAGLSPEWVSGLDEYKNIENTFTSSRDILSVLSLQLGAKSPCEL
jgi:hypothetical protein